MAKETKEVLQRDFKEFVDKVFPECGEQQLYDLSLVWYAGIFCATQEVAKTGNLTSVHVAAYDMLAEYNHISLMQIGSKQ